MRYTMLDDFPEERVTRELTDGEKLLWEGRPRQGLMLRPSDLLMIPLSLVWGGFAIAWETGVVVAGAPWFFKLWGVPFVLVGLYMILGRFFVDAFVRRKTRYAVTSSRVILISGLLSESARSLTLRSVSEMTMTEKSDGSGTIVFGTAYGAGHYASPYGTGARRYQLPAFEGIADVRSVSNLIRRAQESLR